MELSYGAWAGFVAFLIAMLALDLGVFHRKSHVVNFREAMSWSGIWILLALVFAALLYRFAGQVAAFQFLTGYLIEKSLSVDNVFVFALLFTAMRVPRHCEHKVLFWGVFGALVMRVILIVAGVALVERFHWVIYLFGGFLVISAFRMMRTSEVITEPGNHWILRLGRRFLPVTSNYEGDRFFVRRDGKLWITPLLLVLVFVEWSDLVFAVDSIPAILAVSSDPFIVFTSNAFAILGLRSLYFALAGLMDRFTYLKYGLAAILGFVGMKMLLIDLAPIPVRYSLLVIATIAAITALASARRHARDLRILQTGSMATQTVAE